VTHVNRRVTIRITKNWQHNNLKVSFGFI
jgi:hypothetical protein